MNTIRCSKCQGTGTLPYHETMLKIGERRTLSDFEKRHLNRIKSEMLYRALKVIIEEHELNAFNFTVQFSIESHPVTLGGESFEEERLRLDGLLDVEQALVLNPIAWD